MLANLYETMGRMLESWWFQILIMPLLAIILGFVLLYIVLITKEAMKEGPDSREPSEWEHREMKRIEQELYEKHLKEKLERGGSLTKGPVNLGRKKEL